MIRAETAIERAVRKLWKKVFGTDLERPEIKKTHKLYEGPLPFPNSSSQCISTLKILKKHGDYYGAIPEPEEIIPVKIIAHTEESILALKMREEAKSMSYDGVRPCECKPNPYIRNIRKLREDIPYRKREYNRRLSDDVVESKEEFMAKMLEEDK